MAGENYMETNFTHFTAQRIECPHQSECQGKVCNNQVGEENLTKNFQQKILKKVIIRMAYA